MPAKLPDAISTSAIDMYVNKNLGSTTIAEVLGIGTTTVLKILQKAGIECDWKTRSTGKKGRPRFGGDTAKEIADKYAAGAPVMALAAEYQCSNLAIRSAITRSGGTMRSRGNSLREFSPEQIAKMKQLWEDGLSQGAIGRIFGISQTVVSNALSFHGVTLETRRPRGENHGSWKGGRVTNGQGYIAVRIDADSPFASMRNVGGYVQEHRLVMAQAINRPLLPTEPSTTSTATRPTTASRTWKSARANTASTSPSAALIAVLATSSQHLSADSRHAHGNGRPSQCRPVVYPVPCSMLE